MLLGFSSCDYFQASCNDDYPLGGASDAVRAPCGRRANSWYCSGPVRVWQAARAAEAAEVAEVAVQGLSFVSN